MDPIKEAMIRDEDQNGKYPRESEPSDYIADQFDDCHWVKVHNGDLRHWNRRIECLRNHNEALQEREVSYRLALAFLAKHPDISMSLAAIATEALERP